MAPILNRLFEASIPLIWWSYGHAQLHPQSTPLLGLETFFKTVALARAAFASYVSSSNMGIFSRAKDRLIEQLGLAYLNGNLLAPYGRATRLRIDSHLNTISIDAQLNGEVGPIRIDLIDYEVTKKSGTYFAEVREIQTSREWLSKLAADQLVPVKLKLPATLGRLLYHAL